ncbi:Origin recognition complex subunit 3 [Entomophthora muscae]|uniref:Origin recognition complex subunit 3 n=1 Tax=Entomophthora muscae TaxID=34485 RepID=A0ACC2U8Y2_9FUNG|nr:Origin recognition complex subunit 3 [Entomophthora muscae]
MEILEQLFVKSNSIKLSVNSFQLLFDTFNDFTHSITTFLKSLKYALMDHFYSNPLSVLYCSDSIAPTAHLDALALQHEHCELIRMLPSFRSYINGLLAAGLSSTIQDALNNDTYLLTKMVPSMLNRIQAYHQGYPAAFQCFMFLQSWVSKHPCPGTQPLRLHSSVALYNANLTTNIVQLSVFSTLMTSLTSSLASRRINDIQGLLNEMALLIRQAPAPLADEKDIPNPQAWGAELTSFCDSLDKIALSPAQLATRLTALLHRFFQAMLPSYRSLPLNETFYYSKTELLEKTFNPQPQTALEFALTRPRVYLPTPASRQGGAPPVPDAAIAYRLYKEAGRLVNIYDWLKAFEHLVVKQHHKQDPKAKPPTPVDIQARFAQCLNELKFLGYIQATQRKTDHVQKLTWN